MIEVNLTLLFSVFVTVFGLIVILFLNIWELRKQLRTMSEHINQKVPEYRFNSEIDQRHDLEKQVELLYNHFGLIIRTQPSKRIESLKD